MKAAAITGPRQAALLDQPDPQPLGNLVVVEVRAAPMCTEYKAYRDGHPSQSLGHEAAGRVVALAQPGRVQVGDRVAVMPQYPCGRCALCVAGDYIHCQQLLDMRQAGGTATYAQYLLKPDWLLLPLADDLSYTHGSMACCGLGPTFGAMQRLAVNAFDTLLITGMGPVGLGGVVNGVYRGARVIAVEQHPYRRQLALDLGASAALDPTAGDLLPAIMDLTGGLGVDKAIDCSGAAPAQRLLVDATRRRGQVAFVGEAGNLEIGVSRDLIRKGLTLHGSWHWNLADAPKLMQVIHRCGPQIDRLVTHHYPMSAVQEAWELQLRGECGKVILQPWE